LKFINKKQPNLTFTYIFLLY